jgi:2-desacetyl-2-hydroxyethyl bacteriochlorophyllide A dehydrogenase
MRAIRLIGPRQLEPVEIEKPEGDGQHVLMKVSACGICGSDIHYYHGGVGMNGTPGLIMGHEFCGTVADPGNRKDLNMGDRITALPLNHCGTCATCESGNVHICPEVKKRPIPGNNSPGAYAEYVSLRPDMVRKLPDSVSRKGAILIEPAAVALHAVKRSKLAVGDRVLITGGGPIGLLSAAWARLNGASMVVLTEPDPFRKTFAENMGNVDLVLDANDPVLIRTLHKLSKGGFDAAMETSASDAGLMTAITALRPGKRLVLAGINYNPQPISTLMITARELECRGAFAYLPREFDTALDFLAQKKLQADRMVTRVIRLEEVPETFKKMTQAPSNDIKIMIQP